MVDRPMKTLQLTSGERLRLDRQRFHMTCTEQAALLDIPVRRLREQDACTSDPMPAPLAPNEWCRVLRERAGLTLHQLSEMTGLGVPWINRAERGRLRPEQLDVLVQFWERQP
jgi:DNA-binding transcriptional regulator YiaG